MIKAVLKQLSSDFFDSSCHSRDIWNLCVVKGFAIGPIWIVPVLSALSHIFIDIRFMPYGFSLYPANVKIIMSLIYGIVMGGGFYLALSMLPKASPVWKLWKEVLWLFFTVFSITSINYLIRQYLFLNVFYIESLFPVTYFRFLLVGAEVAGVTAVVFEFLQFVMIKSGLQIVSAETDTLVTEGKTICVVGNGKNEQLVFYPETFVYAQSDGNYVKAFYFNPEDGTLENEMLRLSLQDFLEQLSDFDDIVRIHKSFLFNLSQPYVILGNSRKANLKILPLEVEIPVSRPFYLEHQRDMK